MGRSPALSTGKGSVMPGMPLGGLGTGFISLGTDGTLDYVSTIFNEYGARWTASQAAAGPISAVGEMVHVQREHVPTRRLPFLGLSVDGETRILALRSIRGIEAANDIEYWGHYPVADLQYETDLPVSAGLRVWSNFFPGDAVASNAPAAIFEVRLANDSDEAQSGTLAFSFEGPRELDIGIPANLSETIFERQPVTDSISGVTVVAERDGIELGYALAVVGDPTRATWRRSGFVGDQMERYFDRASGSGSRGSRCIDSGGLRVAGRRDEDGPFCSGLVRAGLALLVRHAREVRAATGTAGVRAGDTLGAASGEKVRQHLPG